MEQITKYVPIQFWPYLFLLIAATVLGIVKWRKLGKADRWISVLMCVTLAQELIAKAILIFGDRKNNLYTYNIYSPVEFFLISMYFGATIEYFRKRRIGLKMGLAGVLISILNMLYLQPFHTMGNYYVFFEGLCITVYCFFAFYQILMQEDIQLFVLAGFWLTVCFMLYWCTTFVGWGLFEIASKKSPNLKNFIRITRQASNYLFYIGIVLVFLKYSKLRPSGE